MTPFPGESLGLFYAWSSVDGDATLGGNIHYRGGEGAAFPGTATLPAGEQWRAWVSPGSGTYLTDPDLDLDIAWVLEVDSGTVTVSAAEGIDPGYGDPAAAAPTGLGSHTVTGPATLVIPSTFTTRQVWGDAAGAFMLRLDATSGSAVVSQVKLRAWPTVGVAGGWSGVNPSFDTNPASVTPRAHLRTFVGATDPAGLGTPEAAWDAAVSAYHAAVATGSAVQSSNFATGLGTEITAHRDVGLATLSTYNATLRSDALLFMLTGADPGGFVPVASTFVEGVDWIRPPAEVGGDYAAYVDSASDPVTRWSGTLSLDGSGPIPGGPTLAIQGGTWDDTDPTSLVYYDLGLTHATAAAPGTYSLPGAAPMVLVELSHTAATGAADIFPGYPANDDAAYAVDFAAVRTFVTMPPYRYWSPTAIVQEPLRLRQRSDGLGLGSNRVRGIGSRQNSVRVRGYL